MSAEFDVHADDYADQVERSIAFSGLPHDHFLAAKAELLAETFAAHFGASPPRLLDVGCGIGSLHRFLAPHVSGLAGCDVSAEALARAKASHPEAEYRLSGDTALPFDAAGFDVSLAVCVFHHVPKPARGDLIAEMRRVTRPGGLVAVIEHNPLNPGTRLAVARCSFDRDAELLYAGETEKLFAAAGMASPASRFFLFLPTAHGLAKRIERRLRHVPLGAQYMTIGEVP